MNIDDDFIKSQKAYLQDLIAFKVHPLLLDDRDKIGFGDWEHGYLAYVTRKDALSVLGRVFAGELTFKDCYDWISYIAGRDTIGYERGYRDILSELLYEMILLYETKSPDELISSFLKEEFNKIQTAKFDTTEVDDDD